MSNAAFTATGVFALAVGVGVYGALLPGAEGGRAAAGAASQQPDYIAARTLVCPKADPGPDRTTWVDAVAVPGLPGVSDSGSLSLVRLGQQRAPQLTQVTGTTLEWIADRAAQPMAVADGGLAPGAVASWLAQDRSGEGRGLASAPCTEASARTWLLGGGAAEGQRDTVLLANPTASDAIVDLRAFGPEGPLDVIGQTGIVVRAGDTRTIRLDVVAPGASDVAVEVIARTGIVAAALVDDRMDGLTARGTDVVTGAGDPVKRPVLPPMPGGPGERHLIVLPRHDATVRLTALTTSGEVPLLGGRPLELRAGAVANLDLTEELRGRPAGLRLVSDAKVLAVASASSDPQARAQMTNDAAVARAKQAVRNATGGRERAAAEADLTAARNVVIVPSGEDLALFTRAQPLRSPTAVTGLRSQFDALVLLSATDAPTTAEVAILPGTTSSSAVRPGRTATVPAGTTVAVPLEPPKGADSYTVVITPGDGRGSLRASHVQSGTRGALTGYTVAPLGAQVRLPEAEPQYSMP